MAPRVVRRKPATEIEALCDNVRAVASMNGMPVCDVRLETIGKTPSLILAMRADPCDDGEFRRLIGALPPEHERYGTTALQELAGRVSLVRLDDELAKADQPNITVEDFYAVMPTHSYLFVPTREMWPATSVNARIAPIPEGGDSVRPATWLDTHRHVEQLTWAPGEPMLIADRLIADGGWIEQPGCTCFNLYRPPRVNLGNPTAAAPWLDHVRFVYPDDAEHIIRWLAHRVQRPGEKPNHAIVLGGSQGIGKDTILEPARHAVGAWNCAEVSPKGLLGRFNGFAKSVILRISEARDLGEMDRFAFYDHLKIYTAAPPDTIRCDEKHLREHYVPNVCGTIITTNHSDGIYLPADDRRHFVAWSDRNRNDFPDDYWRTMYRWYVAGGIGHVAAYLNAVDLSSFDAKAPPPKTRAFWTIVDSYRAAEDAALADVLDGMGRPDAITLDLIRGGAADDLRLWLAANKRAVPHRLEAVGYAPCRNDGADDGLWKIGGRRQAVYGRKDLPFRDQLTAARRLSGGQK